MPAMTMMYAALAMLVLYSSSSLPLSAAAPLYNLRPAAQPCDPRLELCRLFQAIDVDGDHVLTSPEVWDWAVLNGARDQGVAYDADTYITWQSFADSAPLAANDPVLDGTTPAEVHTSFLNNNQLAVIWATKENTTTSMIQFGLSATNLNQSLTGTTRTYTAGGWVGVIHEVHLPVFPPSTQVYYHVGDAMGGWSPVYSVKTAPTAGTLVHPDKPIVFATFGDMGTHIPLGYKVCEFIANDSAKLPLDFIVHQGDIAYASTAVTVDSDLEDDDNGDGEQEWVWDVWFKQTEPLSANIPYTAGVGNHEKFYNFSSYLTRFRNPAPWGGDPAHVDEAVFWYSFDYGLVHFTMMSTEHSYDVGSPQYNWIVNDLAQAASRRQTVPWLILVGHRPMYSSDEVEKDDHWPGAHFQQTIEPLMAKYGVDLYFCGHMHMYERMHAVLNGTVMQASAHVYSKPGAPVHVVQGNAGIFEDVKYVNPQPAWSARRESRIGYGRVQVFNATHLFYEARELATLDTMDYFWLLH